MANGNIYAAPKASEIEALRKVREKQKGQTEGLDTEIVSVVAETEQDVHDLTQDQD